MFKYNLIEWLLFFYFYCFIGWVWESCYVSAKKHKWINRGFMHGPFLPLYGSGAVTILLITIPFRGNNWIIFFVGMIGATILEYFTGAAMEKMFHVRYWDYSNQKLNLNGHICVTSSIAWGVLSVLLVSYAHKPVERLFLQLPALGAQIITFVLTIYIAIDLTQSFNEAMDLKAILKNLTESKDDEIRQLQKRLEVVSAFFDDDTRNFKEKIEQTIKKKEYIRSLRLLRRNPGATSAKYKAALDAVKKSIPLRNTKNK